MSIYENLNYDSYNNMQSSLQGDTITLPFETAFFRWQRSQPAAKREISPVQHFGGWVSSADKFPYSFIENAPEGFLTSEIMTSSKGTGYQVYSTRALIVSPIGMRKAWRNDRYGNKRSHVQYLCYGAYPTGDKKIVPWKPIILTAKGLTAKSLEDAISKFSEATAKVRYEHAKGAPPFLFWCALGSFGDKPVTKTVGSGNQQNYITPIQLYLPDDVTPDYIDRIFVGADLAQTLPEIFDESQEWLSAWDDLDEDDDGAPSDYDRGYNDVSSKKQGSAGYERQRMQPPPSHFDDPPF